MENHHKATFVRWLEVAVLFAAVIAYSECTSVRWASAASGQWTEEFNWAPNIIPGASDDVAINDGTLGASESIFLGTRVTVRSLQVDLLGNIELKNESGIAVTESMQIGPGGKLKVDVYNHVWFSGPGSWNITGRLDLFKFNLLVSGVPSFRIASSEPLSFGGLASTLTFEDSNVIWREPPSSELKEIDTLSLSRTFFNLQSEANLAPMRFIASDSTVIFENASAFWGYDGVFSNSLVDFASIQLGPGTFCTVISSSVRIFGPVEFGVTPTVLWIGSTLEFYGNVSLRCPTDSDVPRAIESVVRFRGRVDASCGMQLSGSTVIAENVLNYNSEGVEEGGKYFLWIESSVFIRGAVSALFFERYGSFFDIETSNVTIEQSEVSIRLGNGREIAFRGSIYTQLSGSAYIGPGVDPNAVAGTLRPIDETIFICVLSSLSVHSGNLTLDTIFIDVQSSDIFVGGSLIGTNVTERIRNAAAVDYRRMFTLQDTRVVVAGGDFLTGNGHALSVIGSNISLLSSGSFQIQTNSSVNASGSRLTISSGGSLFLRKESALNFVESAASVESGNLLASGSHMSVENSTISVSGNLILVAGTSLTVARGYVSVFGGSVIVDGSQLIVSDSTFFNSLGGVTLRNGGLLRLINSTLQLVDGALSVDETSKFDVDDTSKVVNVGSISGGGEMAIPFGADVVVKPGGEIKLNETSSLTGDGKIVIEGLFVVAEKGASNVDLVNFGVLKFEQSTGNFSMNSSVSIPSNAPRDATILFRNGARVSFSDGSGMELQQGLLLGDGVVDGDVVLNNAVVGSENGTTHTSLSSSNFTATQNSTVHAHIGVGSTSTILTVLGGAQINGSIIISLPSSVLADPSAYSQNITLITSLTLTVDPSKVVVQEIKPDGSREIISDCRVNVGVDSRSLAVLMGSASECAAVPRFPTPGGANLVGESFPVLAVTLGVIGGVVAVSVAVGAAWYILRARRLSQARLQLVSRLKSQSL